MSLGKFVLILSVIALSFVSLTVGVLYSATRQQAYAEGQQTVQRAAESSGRGTMTFVASPRVATRTSANAARRD